MEYAGSSEINKGLQDWSRIILKVYNDHLDLGISLEPERMKKEVLKIFNSPREKFNASVFWTHFDAFIKYKKSVLPDSRDYDNSLRKHLLKTESIFGSPLNLLLFKNRSGGFLEIFDEYLTHQAINSNGEKGLTVNTIGKQYKNLKVFLNWCFSREIIQPYSLKHLVTKTEEVDSIYLNEEEIDSLMQLELKDEKEETVRDLFIIGCETGLRFSDFSRLKSHHIKKDRIEIHQKKISKKVIVPVCTDTLQLVLKKYANNPPQYESITEFNRIIRQLCKSAGITEEVSLLKTQANKKREVIFKKYELVTSHTCRRSFCTNHFLNGMPVTLIMAISGHKTERAFMRYLKIDNNKKIDLFKENMVLRKKIVDAKLKDSLKA